VSQDTGESVAARPAQNKNNKPSKTIFLHTPRNMRRP
jgi:hypothetical protein